MATIDCKNCGKQFEIDEDASLAVCPACGAECSLAPEAEEPVFTDTVFEAAQTSEPATQLNPDTPSPGIDDVAEKNAVYFSALSKMGGHNVNYYYKALEELRTIPGWRDADELIEECLETIPVLEEEERRFRSERDRKAGDKKLLKFIGIPFLALIAIATAVFFLAIKPMLSYKQAAIELENGNIVAAYETWAALGTYKDSEAQAKKLFEAYKAEKPKLAAVGDTLFFGEYELDGKPGNGKEALSWTVLDKKGGKLFLICDRAVDYVPYCTEETAVSWENSNVRAWLSNEFFQSSFDEIEKSSILTTRVTADANPDFETDPGTATEDTIFLLSCKEAEHYFTKPSERMCEASAAAVSAGVDVLKTGEYENAASWLLRTPGFDETMVCYVECAGTLRHHGIRVNTPQCAVRPAMWISTEE